MDIQESAESFARQFHAIYHRFHQRVPQSQYRPSRESLAVLQHLGRSGPLTVLEAAKHFSRSQAAMSEIFARLEKRNLVERIKDERDRRRTLVWLSEEGNKLRESSEQVLAIHLLEKAFAQLDDSARQSIEISLAALLNTQPVPPGEQYESK